jgi:hypothetical protein
MSADQAVLPIVAIARVLGVSKAGFDAWLHRPPWSRPPTRRLLPGC